MNENPILEQEHFFGKGERKLEANELYDLCEAMEISPTELRNRYNPRIPV